MAWGVFRKIVAGHGKAFQVDAAGTHDYHIGKPPFPLAVEAAKRRGIDITHHISRRVGGHDLDHFDMILAMDRSNLSSLNAIAPTRCKGKIELFLEYGDTYHGQEVPDPMGGEAKDFDHALDMIEDGCRGLAKLLIRNP